MDEDEKKIRELERLLERWNCCNIPPEFWSQPGEDCTLPLDTQIALSKRDHSEEI